MKFFDAMAQVAAGERVCRADINGEPRWLWLDAEGGPREGLEGDNDVDWLLTYSDITADDWEVRAAPVSVGSFTWALDQVQHGKRVRRQGCLGGLLGMDCFNLLVVNGAVVQAPELSRMVTYSDWEVVE